jgi:tetratricopeptide (TPR) repeat protein
LLLVLAGVGAGLYWFWHVDWDEVEKLNDRGVALMDRFEYDQAVAVFEDVDKKAPGWMTGRINLGIALMNNGSKKDADLIRAQDVFQAILKDEPDNPYAHFCLGIMATHGKDVEKAIPHFEIVLRHDPRDPHTLCWLADVLPFGDERKLDYCRQALEIQPAFTTAIYVLQQHLNRQVAMTKAPDKKAELKRQADELTKRFNDLDRSKTGASFGIKYSDMGKYAEVIARRPTTTAPPTGPLPLFQQHELTVQLAPGARWATTTDLGQDAVGRLRAALRKRFGATVIVLDYNGDGRPDLFLAGAVVENGKVRDLLLRNEGNWTFRDVTAEAGLSKPHPTLGANAADFDNDGRTDLLLTGAGSQRLFHNKGDGTFEDVSSKADLDKVHSVCLGSAFVDLDQDADLDLLLAEYAATPEEALHALDGGQPGRGGLLVFINKGDWLAAPPGTSPALTTRFERSNLFPGREEATAPLTNIATSDVDGDQDLDLLTLPAQGKPGLWINDRTLRFRGSKALESVTSAAAWNGAVVLDVDHDRRSDLFLISADQPPALLLNRAAVTEPDVSRWFVAGPTNSPKLLQAVVGDIDLDGWTDIVGLSSDRLPVLLHNEGGKLPVVPQGLGADAGWPKDLVAVTLCDVDGDGFLDLITWSEGEGLQLHRNQGNGHHALRLQLVGARYIYKHYPMICNEDGIGAWVWTEPEKGWAGQELTTLSAGLGQSRQPLLLGLGKQTVAGSVRVRWPDGCWQAELDVPADKLTRISDLNRKPGSCPILFTWDGEKWVFITDFLGAGSVGEIGPDLTCRPPRPEESIKIEPGLLAPKDGHYLLSITEPMNEVTYLDKVQLVAIDHPAGVRVYLDERFTSSGPPASQELIAFDQEIFPQSARDHRGQDVTEALRCWDRVTVDGFWRRGWVGFAEDHFVELDFADRLAKFGPKDRLYLCLAGWIDYPFPESIWAAHQAGIEMQFPVLERQNERGEWVSLGDAGFPAGLPRMMLLDVTGKLTGPKCRLRLRTNLQIFWDQAFIAAGCRTITPGGKDEVRAQVLDVHQAELTAGIVPKEVRINGHKPPVYEHDRKDPAILTPPAGKRTVFGDVTELLRAKDDCFVIFGPGDELRVQFDAGALPPLPAGWQRSFVLRSCGYCKDSGPFIAHGATIEPLPFGTMKNYPPTGAERSSQDEKYRGHLRRYQTREATTPR